MELWFLGLEFGQIGTILISLLRFLQTKRTKEQAGKSLQAARQWKAQAKENCNYHTLAFTYALCFCLASQVICLMCPEEFTPAQKISTPSRSLTFDKSGAWPFWKCTCNSTWFLVQSLTYGRQLLGVMVQTSSSDKDEVHTETLGLCFRCLFAIARRKDALFSTWQPCFWVVDQITFSVRLRYGNVNANG